MIVFAVAICFVQTAHSEPLQAPTPGVITQGSENVTIGGAAAVRQGERTSNATAIVQGSSNVFINGKPAVTLGDQTNCGGVIVSGASGVLINGKPVARVGDVTTGCSP